MIIRTKVRVTEISRGLGKNEQIVERAPLACERDQRKMNTELHLPRLACQSRTATVGTSTAALVQPTALLLGTHPAQFVRSPASGCIREHLPSRVLPRLNAGLGRRLMVRLVSCVLELRRSCTR